MTEHAGDETHECPLCDTPMERREEHATTGRFGSDEDEVRSTRAYYKCPKCGYEARL